MIILTLSDFNQKLNIQFIAIVNFKNIYLYDVLLLLKLLIQTTRHGSHLCHYVHICNNSNKQF